jgi:hypothetical protein
MKAIMATSVTAKKMDLEADEKTSSIFYEKLIARVNRRIGGTFRRAIRVPTANAGNS